jgi:DNA-binding transcriptional LysR family regulator
MEIRHLRYFIAVAEELSFSRAAKRLNVSQPPLSVQIQALEAEIGVALFIRNRRKVELTPAGQLLLEHARRAVKHLEHTTNVVRRAGRGEAGVIRLAFTGSVPMRESFALLLRTFRSRYPDIRIELQHMTTGRQFAALKTTRSTSESCARRQPCGRRETSVSCRSGMTSSAFSFRLIMLWRIRMRRSR